MRRRLALAFTIVLAAAGGPFQPLGARPAAAGPSLRLHDIQGAAHRSPLVGQVVSGLVGIVTAVDGGGYYLQDPLPDSNDATSEAIFVDTVGAPSLSVGDAIVISGTVAEFYPAGPSASGLSVTQLDPPFTVTVQSTGNALPAAIVVGSGGRIPPNTVIDDDATGNVETSGTFDAVTDGIDFWESLEGMRVQVNNALVVGGTLSFGELTLVGDSGANGGLLNPRGALVLGPNDYNPERLILDDGLVPTPVVNAGAYFTAPVVGVIDYTFGNFKLQATTLPVVNPGTLVSETTPLTRTAAQLTLATFNVENLDPSDPPAKFAALADRIVNHLLAPDLIAVEEVQDNTGATNNGVVDASQTYDTLITAIVTAGGPAYTYRQIDPVNNQDGGEPGGNIRVGFLFRTDRGLSFIDRPGGTATAAASVVAGANGPELSFSPGRINPGSSAFASSRKPLAGEFLFHGVKLFVIANHWNSKSGDDALMGRFQPPTLSSQVQRLQIAQEVHSWVADILALDPSANVVALGDLNDFQDSPPLTTLTAGGVLTTLITTLAENERYTYVFDGNAQVLDHILVSPNLFQNALAGFDVVHVNAELAAANRASDHDPSLVRLLLAPGGLADSAKTVSALSVAAGDLLTYTLTISNNDSVAVSFVLTDTLDPNLTLVSAPGLSGTTTLTGTGLLAPNAQQAFVMTVRPSFTFSGTLNNTASLSGDGQTRLLVAPPVSVAARFALFLPQLHNP